MAAVAKNDSKESSTISILSGWAQQGVQTLFATQRILIDLAMRQNASIMHAVRQQLSDPHHSPSALLSEMAETGMENFIEGQKVLLELGKQQNEILMNGVKERVGDCPRRRAVVDFFRRSIDTFILMQEEYLKIASKQSHTWLESAKDGKPFQPEHVIELAHETMDNFVRTQKRFLDVVGEEAEKATTKRTMTGASKAKKTELAVLARQATDSLLEAQKKLVDVAGEQMSANMRSAEKAMKLVKPFPFPPLNELTHEVVKSYVDAQKALMDVVVKSPAAKGPRRPTRKAKAAVAVA